MNNVKEERERDSNQNYILIRGLRVRADQREGGSVSELS